MLNLIYLQSKLFIAGLTRKRFELKSDNQILWAVNNSQNSFLALVMASGLSLQVLPYLVMAIRNGFPFDPTLIGMLCLELCISAVGLRHLLWLINGRQEMIIENGKMFLQKHGTFFTRPQVFLVKDISNVGPVNVKASEALMDQIFYNIRLSRRIVFRQITGEIAFHYQGRDVEAFCNLNDEERETLIMEIKNRIFNSNESKLH